ncbi:MAG TPA: hypothetical protein VGN26_01885 [Armatimonadota bacterium]|jgi:hypothetical protein
MEAHLENPRGLVPISLILDDSCPVLNLTRPWIRDCWDIAPPHRGQTPRVPWQELPEEIPADFARAFADWAGKEGVKGKFSVVPMPAGLGRIDQSLPGVPASRLEEWLSIIRDRIHPSFDLTPEMITHTFAVDLGTWRMLPRMEQYDWTPDRTAEELTEYQATALTLLRNVGIAAEGVTSPGGYAHGGLDAYAQATLDSSLAVNGLGVTFFFKEVESVPVPPRVHLSRPERGQAAVSVIACTDDWFGNWTGWDLGSPDLCITEDLQAGRLVEWIRAGQPAIICSHWPGYYFHDGSGRGFDVCKEVVRRLNRLDGVLWMRTSEIARYWAAREVAAVTCGPDGVALASTIACPAFTFRLTGAPDLPLWSGDEPLGRLSPAEDLRPGTVQRRNDGLWVCADLQEGDARLTFSESRPAEWGGTRRQQG